MQILTAAELEQIRRIFMGSAEPEGVISKLLKALERVQKALPDPHKLELLADWFDAQQVDRGWASTEVQADLRQWAEESRQALRDTGWEVTDDKD